MALQAKLQLEPGQRVDGVQLHDSNDGLTWVAYPKSGQLGTDLHRDSLAALLMASGIKPVCQIAVDEVWSALRFRPG
jgi:hypothetical protein